MSEIMQVELPSEELVEKVAASQKRTRTRKPAARKPATAKTTEEAAAIVTEAHTEDVETVEAATQARDEAFAAALAEALAPEPARKPRAPRRSLEEMIAEDAARQERRRRREEARQQAEEERLAHLRTLVPAVRAHAQKWYASGGWDVIEETWTDEDLLAELLKHPRVRTEWGAIVAFYPIVVGYREADAAAGGPEARGERAAVVEADNLDLEAQTA